MLLRWWYLLLPEPGDWLQEASFSGLALEE